MVQKRGLAPSRTSANTQNTRLGEAPVPFYGTMPNMTITVNGQAREVGAEATIAGLLDEFNLANKPVAVEVNLELVPRQRHTQHRLAEGDRLEIVTLVGGG
jgi:sulfur carrier protein